jgi:hypothetical protein
MNEEEIPHSEERKIPPFLIVTYIIVIIGGLLGLIAYWNGSHGWLDRGYWQPLQKAAETTSPFKPKDTLISG